MIVGHLAMKLEESIGVERTTLKNRLNDSYSFLKGENKIYNFLGYSVISSPLSTGPSEEPV